jgi:arylsulfatase A-like enzyme
MAMPDDRPNLLLLFPDQWRWDWLGCESSPYGKVPVRTPNIDALAERGTRITGCRTNSPLCSPARACLATGRRFGRTGVVDNTADTPTDLPTVFKLLRDAGYRTLTCGKNDLHKASRWKGRDGWTSKMGRYGFTEAINHSGKFDAEKGVKGRPGPHCSYSAFLQANGLYEDYKADYDRRRREKTAWTAAWPTPLPDWAYTDNVCGQRALDLLDRQPQEGPWCLWVNWPGPHDPFDPPAGVLAGYDGVAFPEPVNGTTAVDGDDDVRHQEIRRAYAACCTNIDTWVGRILDAVARRGELDNTLVLFASDHGEMLGDHGRFLKHTWQEGSVHVPLVAAGPGVQAGCVSESLADMTDLGVTLLAAAGERVPEEMDGRSLLPVLAGEAGSARDVVVSQLGNWQSACDGRHKLVRHADGKVECFDLRADPHELSPVDDRPEHLASALDERGVAFSPLAGL